MLYLAQVQKQELTGKLILRLLASQEAEHTWIIMAEPGVIPLGELIAGGKFAQTLTEGLLVLVKLSAQGDVESLHNAKDWVLELLQTYLTNGITPAFLQQETQRAEHWRQNLTLQNQEIARRLLEVEARREQIQALEKNIKREQDSNED